MKKTIKIIILAACLLLVGCGKKQEDTLAQNSFYDVINDAEVTEDIEDETDESDILDEGEEDEEYDDEEIKTTTGAKGIIAMIHDGPSLSISETIISIDPDNGQTRIIAEYQFSNNTDFKDFLIGTSSEKIGYANLRNLYSEDYDKRAISKYLSDGSWHAGWINTKGDFFDISKAVGEVPESDFAELPKHDVIGFAWSGKFVYSAGYDKNQNVIYHVVNPKKISKGKFKETTKWDSHAYLNNQHLQPTDWLDDTRCLADEYETKSLTGMCNGSDRNSVIYDTKKDKIIEYIPGDNSLRNNWSGVVGPDGKQIAFLSMLSSGKDKGDDVRLYITSSKGGEPRKVEIEAPDGLKLRIENSLSNNNYHDAYCTLLDWK